MKIIDRSIVFQDTGPASPARVACFPGLAQLSDGRLLCTFRIGSSKDSADETIRVAQSQDNGQSWQLLPFTPTTTLDGKRGSLRVAHLAETAPGHLRLHSGWIDRSDPDAPISHPETGGCLESKVVVFQSNDGGETWSDIEEVPGSPFEQPELSGPLINLSQPGHLLQPMENQKHYHDPNPIDEKAFAWISRDGGKTWPEWAMIAHDFPSRKFWCNRVARFPSGKLACVSWAFDEKTQRDLPLHIIYGSPDGLEWGEPFSLGVEGQVSYLLALDESTLLMSTSHRLSPAGIRLRKSTDGGRTWDSDGLLVLDAESQSSQSGGDLADYYKFMTNYTFGWSPMVQLNDEEILMVYFAGNSQTIGVHSVRISLA